MTVSFQVGDREFGGAGNLEVDFWVRVASWTCSVQIGPLPGSRFATPKLWMPSLRGKTASHIVIFVHGDLLALFYLHR